MLEGGPLLDKTFRALRHRNYRLFLGGQIVSLVGTWMQNVAQGWLVYRLTHSEMLLGTAWFCTQIPVFALSALGGVASDRYPRRRIVVVTQALSMLQALALGVLTLTGKVAVWHVLGLSLALGIVNAFDIPARQSLIVELSGREDLPNAISLNSAVFNAARVVGPGLAGVLVAAFGEGVCFLMNGVSFMAVIAGLLAMRLAPPEPRAHAPAWAYLVEGFRYAWNHHSVRTLLLMLAACTLTAMPLLVLMPFFAGDIFQRGSQGLGWLLGAMGVGAVAGTLALARRRGTAGLPRVILSSSLLMGVAMAAFAVSPSFHVSVAIMPVIGYSIVRQNASGNTLIQSLIPDRFRGRVMSLFSIVSVGLGPFGSLATGALAQAHGARVTVFVGGGLLAAAAAWFRLGAREIEERIAA